MAQTMAELRAENARLRAELEGRKARNKPATKWWEAPKTHVHKACGVAFLSVAGLEQHKKLAKAATAKGLKPCSQWKRTAAASTKAA